MKKCLECHTEHADGAPTCLACGGGSWPAATAKSAPAKPATKTMAPPEAVLTVEPETTHDVIVDVVEPRMVPRRSRGPSK